VYYVLDCFGPVDEDRAGIGDIVNTELPWETGRPFPQPPPTPVIVELNPDFPGVMVPMFDSGVLLFSDEMLAALDAAGVDNLDRYEAVVRDPVTGRAFTNYKAVNIVGVVACADLAQSVYQAPSGSALVDTDFDSLAIDEARALGLSMFRLAECVTAILVHERVRRYLEAAGIPHLDFHEPQDWIG